MVMIEVIANDRLGKKVRVKVDSDDTVETLKVLPPTSTQTTLPRCLLSQFRWQTLMVENDRCTDRDGLAKDCP
jgi:hypothetical protein